MALPYLFPVNKSSNKVSTRLFPFTSLFFVLLIQSQTSLATVNPNDSSPRPSDRPLVMPDTPGKKPPVEFSLPPIPESKPEDTSATGDILVKEIAFDGNREISTDELMTIAKPFTGRRLRPAEMEELRHKLTRYYIGKGFVNSGALLREDAYQDGKLTYQIVEGQLEDIRISGQQRLHESYIKKRLSRDDEVLNVNVLQERFQLLLTDPLFSKVNAQILPGSKPGQAILDVDVTRAKPYQLSLFADNHHAPSTGSKAYGSTGWIRNLTGFGDLLDATYQTGKGNSRKGLGWTVPLLNSYGTTAEARYDEGDSVLIEETFRPLDIRSKFRSKDFTLSQPVINGLRQQLKLGLTWSTRQNKTTLLGESFSFAQGERDGLTKTEVWRFYQDYLQRSDDSVFVGRSTFSSGRNNLIQDPNVTTIPEKYFLVWLGQFQYAYRLIQDDTRLVAKGLAQLTPNHLASLEKISIGGASTVRGYRESHLLRDAGYAVNLELHHPMFGKANSNEQLEALMFYDYGVAYNKGDDKEYLSSVGIGFAGQYKRLSGELYLAARLRKNAVVSGSDLQDKGIHFQVRYDLF